MPTNNMDKSNVSASSPIKANSAPVMDLDVELLNINAIQNYREAPIVICDSSDESNEWTSDSDSDSNDEASQKSSSGESCSSSSSSSSSSEDDVEEVFASSVANKKSQQMSQKAKDKRSVNNYIFTLKMFDLILNIFFF